MGSFGLSDYIAGTLRPHIMYYRRQGMLLAVAAVFGLATGLFLLIGLFFALLYLMPPFWAAMLCAALCGLVAAAAMMDANRRARIRRRTSAEVVAIDEGRQAELDAGRLQALGGMTSTLLPALAVAVFGYIMGRRTGR